MGSSGAPEDFLLNGHWSRFPNSEALSDHFMRWMSLVVTIKMGSQRSLFVGLITLISGSHVVTAV